MRAQLQTQRKVFTFSRYRVPEVRRLYDCVLESKVVCNNLSVFLDIEFHTPLYDKNVN